MHVIKLSHTGLLNINILQTCAYTIDFLVVLVVLVLYPPDHGSALLNSPEQSSVTAPSLGKLSSSNNQYQMPSLSQGTASYFCTCHGSANDRRNNSMINHNKSDLYHPGIEPRSPDSYSNTLPIELIGVTFKYSSISNTSSLYRVPFNNMYNSEQTRTCFIYITDF